MHFIIYVIIYSKRVNEILVFPIICVRKLNLVKLQEVSRDTQIVRGRAIGHEQAWLTHKPMIFPLYQCAAPQPFGVLSKVENMPYTSETPLVFKEFWTLEWKNIYV